MPKGNIASTATLDTLSTNGVTSFPPLAIGGVQKEMETIFTGEDEPVVIMDPAESAGQHPRVPGVATPPAVATPPFIERPTIIAQQNTTVFFEGILVTVSGDAMAQVPSSPVPDPRPLTEPTLYPTILIGTQIT